MSNLSKGPIKPAIQLYVIIISWLAVQFALYLRTGIQPILESLKYINAAEALLTTGELPGLRYFFYLTTTLVIAFCLKVGIGIKGVVIVQLALSLISTVYFFKTLEKIQINKYSAFVTTLLLIGCFPFYIWNFYLYTESIFYSLGLLFFSYCLRNNVQTTKSVITQFILLVSVIVSRPLGILFLPCWIIYLLLQSNSKKKGLLIFGSTSGLIILILIANTILGNIKGWQVLLPFEYNYIICDIPSSTYKSLENLKNRPPLFQIINYIFSYPSEFLQLTSERLQAFFFLTRSYYSNGHNASLIVLDIILYIPIIINIIFYRKNEFRSNFIFPISIILMFSLAVSLQCDDYHSRFHNAIFPVFLYAGVFKFIESSFLLKSRTF